MWELEYLHRGKGFEVPGTLLLARDANVNEHTPGKYQDTAQFVGRIFSVSSSLRYDDPLLAALAALYLPLVVVATHSLLTAISH